MGKVITVASGKGGTGKTTTVAAISSCLAALGYKTLCIDFDTGLKNLDLSLCMTDFAVTDYMDIVSGHIPLMDACNASPSISNLYFLAAPTVYDPNKLDPAMLIPMFDEIRQNFDYCLVDSPSGIDTGFRLAHTSADMSIIVTTGEQPAMRDAQHIAVSVRDMGIRDLRLLVNRVMPGKLRIIHTTIDDVIDNIGVRLLGIVPEDSSVFFSLHDSVPLILYRKRRAAYDFLDAARRIAGENVPLRQR